MNERIQELAAQAIDYFCDNEKTKIMDEKVLENFAELILRDVMLDLHEYDKRTICKVYGLEYTPTMQKNPSYGDLLTAKEWFECVDCGAFISDDGSGYWATEKEHSIISCWDEQPKWATHVLWFNK